MKMTGFTASLALCLAVLTMPYAASAASLSELESACRTGDYASCSRYNAAVVARYSAQQPVLNQGYDPFALVPATHSERLPKLPQPDSSTGKPGLVSVSPDLPR